MAITITKNPSSPNLANNTVVYAVTSTKDAEPQFRYVLDINDRNGNLLQRIKQQPNQEYGVGIFDIGQILTTYLGPTDEVWKSTTDNTPNINAFCADQFLIRFGEEYATSATSSTNIYVGGAAEQIGTPSISSSYYDYYIDGVVNVNGDKIDYNWNSSSKYDVESTDGTTTFNHQNGLTEFNTSSVRLEDYHTISILNGNVEGVYSASVDNTLAQDIYAILVKEYDSSNSLLATNTYYNLSGPRSITTELWDDVYEDQTYRTQLLHWPVGPANINAGANPLNSNTAYYVVSFHNQTLDPAVNDNGIYGEYRFNITDKNCGYDGVRFAWKNEYGVWDYFNFGLAESTESSIEREQFEQVFVDYGALVPTADPTRRGFQQFQNRVNKTRTAQSDYLTQSEADNIRELFFSTNVYVQDGDDFYPVVIENASVTEKTNPRSQKLFTYQVTYRYANDQRPRV